MEIGDYCIVNMMLYPGAHHELKVHEIVRIVEIADPLILVTNNRMRNFGYGGVRGIWVNKQCISTLECSHQEFKIQEKVKEISTKYERS